MEFPAEGKKTENEQTSDLAGEGGIKNKGKEKLWN